MRSSHAFAAMALVFLLGCSPKPASVFKDPEIAYLRGLFRPYSQPGWPTRRMMGQAEREAAALASFRTHPAEVLPLLSKGWDEGWWQYPWPEEKPPRVAIPANDDNLLHLIICLDPAAAEAMLVNKFRSLKGAPRADSMREFLLSTLYWRLHSKQSMGLFKELMAEDPDQWRFPFVIYCAQENDRAGLADAKVLLRAYKEKREPVEAALREAAVYQLEGDTEALQQMYLRHTSWGLYALWGLVFMGRQDLLPDLLGSLAGGDGSITFPMAVEKWELDKAKPPYDSGPVKTLFEMAVVNQYTPHRPTL